MLRKSFSIAIALVLIMSVFAVTAFAEEVVITDFSDANPFEAGLNTSSVQHVTGFANGPGAPETGSHSIEAITDGVDAIEWRTIVANGSWDLTGATSFYYHINSYGGAPDTERYETSLKLTNSAGAVFEGVAEIVPDQWNNASFDISGFDASQITSVEIGFHAVSTFGAWAPHFQVDVMGYVAGDAGDAPAAEAPTAEENPATGSTGTMLYVFMALLAVAGLVTFRRFSRHQH